MSAEFKEISLRGKRVKVPAVLVEDRVVVTLGKWVRMASVHDEVWLEGAAVKDPHAAVAKIQQSLPADIFTFAQKLPDVTPKFKLRMEWDNVAAIPLTTYADWWENRVPQETRKNIRRAGRRGVSVRIVAPDDEFIRGITRIYNETPIRQGKPFSKFGHDFATVKSEILQLCDRSVFIGAYLGLELLGFVKLVMVNEVASILSINSLNSHFDKRPTNALLAKCVEVAIGKGKSHLVYGRYNYGNKTASPLTEFKRRNGFLQINLPRYYIPLNWRGHVILALNGHRGLVGMLPGSVADMLVNLRAWAFRKFSTSSQSIDGAEASEAAKAAFADNSAPNANDATKSANSK